MSRTPDLVLGPLVRWIGETGATVWVETTVRCEVRIIQTDGARHWSARTFAVHGHHYALVLVDGLHPGEEVEYGVELHDPEAAVESPGRVVWPPLGDILPPSRIATLDPARPLRLAFGSCRTSVAHDDAGTRLHGVDALRAYGLALAGVRRPVGVPEANGMPGRTTGPDAEQEPPVGPGQWPDLVCFLGDQVYADETTAEVQEMLASRRSLDVEPGPELKDFEEYSQLYRIAWSDPVVRWLLASLPSSMIFDDHDIRDDWNSSERWREEIRRTRWWQGRVVAGLAAYWVHQHLGNLAPEDLAVDPVWRRVQESRGEDLGTWFDAFAARADADPESYRWSFERDLGRTRLLVVDTRAARVLEEGSRAMLDAPEMAWLEERLRGADDLDHVLIGSSLPFLLTPGLHHLEAWDEAMVGGGWRGALARPAEKLRTAVDLEHWAAFQDSFARVGRLITDLADGARGPAPRTVTLLSGDVHHSYLSEVHRESGARVLQAVCSPLRNPLPMTLRWLTSVMSYGLGGPMGLLVGRAKAVPDPPFTWDAVAGPWFDNNLAVLQVTGEGLTLDWWTGEVPDGDTFRPTVHEVAAVHVVADGRGSRAPTTSRVREESRPGRRWRSFAREAGVIAEGVRGRMSRR